MAQAGLFCQVKLPTTAWVLKHGGWIIDLHVVPLIEMEMLLPGHRCMTAVCCFSYASIHYGGTGIVGEQAVIIVIVISELINDMLVPGHLQVYDSGDGMLAARYWWMLTAQGHPQPLVLERGWAGWRAAEYPTQLYEPCTLKVGPSRMRIQQPHQSTLQWVAPAADLVQAYTLVRQRMASGGS
jgi:hypothetical protein